MSCSKQCSVYWFSELELVIFMISKINKSVTKSCSILHILSIHKAFYSCGLSTATIVYLLICVCVSVSTITQNIINLGT